MQRKLLSKEAKRGQTSGKLPERAKQNSTPATESQSFRYIFTKTRHGLQQDALIIASREEPVCMTPEQRQERVQRDACSFKFN